ncbi:MAG: hypothetical protein H7Y18_05420 [Clostridiaceae bacterium]|nr:hypothetical protein [Clostridiaceae bacterium]
MSLKILPKAILFDLDDTIISFDGVADYAWEKTCKSFVKSEKTRVNIIEVWMVGDNLVWDIEAPKKAGIFAVWNDYRRKELPKGSIIILDRIINDISELISRGL